VRIGEEIILKVDGTIHIQDETLYPL